MNTSELLLGVSSVALQALLLVILVSRGLQRSFRWFLAYLTTNFLFGAGLVLIRNQPRSYFYTYWIGDAIVASLAILATYEIFRGVFQKFYTLPGFRALFPGASVLFIFLGSIRAFEKSGSLLSEYLLISQIFSLEIIAYILQFGLFFLLLLLIQFFRLSWKQYTFGIAVGFGVSAAGSLVAFMVRSEFGTKFDPVFRFVVPLTYTVGVAIWLLTFLWPVHDSSIAVPTPALTPEAVVAELKQYTRTVKEILKR